MNNAAHRVKLIEILKDFYKDTELRTALGFKGGTAAMLFYELPRFSVDLDFDLLKSDLEDRVFEKVQAILAKHGDLREARKKRYTLFFLLGYGPERVKLKVEISRRPATGAYGPKSYLGIPMLVMTKEDMLASKLSALLTRRKPAMRDIFDTWFFLKSHWPINEILFEEKSGMSMDDGLNTAIQHIKAIRRNELLQGLGELLDQGQKDQAREKMAEETVFYLELLQDSRRKTSSQ